MIRHPKHLRAPRSKTWTYTIILTVELILLAVVCGGGAAVEKEAYIPSNWGTTCHMCNGYSAANNCGHSRKDVISGGGKQATKNSFPSTFPKEWSHMIPSSLYFAIMASSGHITPPSLRGRCAVLIGSGGTGSMKRALMLTGIFVIGIDIKPTVDAGVEWNTSQ